MGNVSVIEETRNDEARKLLYNFLEKFPNANTKAAYRVDVRKFLDYADTWQVDVRAIGEKRLIDLLQAYFNSLSLASATKARKAAALTAYLEFITPHMLLGKFVFSRKTRPMQIVNPADVDRLLAHPELDSRSRALIAVIAFSGTQVSKLQNLPKGYRFTETAKRNSPIDLDEILAEYIKDRYPSRQGNFLFTNYVGRQMSRQTVWASVQKAGEAIGLFELTPQKLRSSFIIRLFEANYQDEDIANLLNSDLSTVQRHINTWRGIKKNAG